MSRRLCKNNDCDNFAAENRRICNTCKSHKFKQRYPFKYFYNNYKQNAKKRNIPWDLSFDEFKQIWQESGKWEEKLNGENWSFQRKRINEGYHYDNIEVIPIYLNVDLFWTKERWEIDFRWRERWSKLHDRPVEECPF